MKVIFMGISIRKGISNKGQGSPYEMNKIHFATPISPIDSANMSYSGYGLQEQTLDVDPLCIKQFEQVKPLSEVNVIVEPKPTNFSQTWVVGLTQ
jgi:hypothetical protein